MISQIIKTLEEKSCFEGSFIHGCGGCGKTHVLLFLTKILALLYVKLNKLLLIFVKIKLMH